MQISHYLPRALPEPLEGLATLACDLRWSWNHGADTLWREISPELWEATGNPWLIVESVSDSQLTRLADDARFLSALQKQLAARAEHYAAETWFPSHFGDAFSGQIAYFSMEFGVSESLPIYSGGLGVLAGDVMKTACDLDVPLIGIGLLYQQGYFRQALDRHGEQLEFYPFNDPTQLPIVPLRKDGGEWVSVTVELPGRPLRLRAWHVKVGRRSLLLLDSNDPLNHPGDRGITSELYGGGAEIRLQQEMVLGIGGWRLLETLGIDCPVCHLNEGHAAFAVLERARSFMRREQTNFATALRATRAGNLFTTHTPVAAGFDQFSTGLFSLYFTDYARDLGLSLAALLALGRGSNKQPDAPFNMACLAVRGAGAVNGVSRLHGEVSRGIFQSLFPRWPRREVPVSHVTNGVHVPSWDSAEADTLWTDACGKGRWRGELTRVSAAIAGVADEEIWKMRNSSRRRLVAFLGQRGVQQHGQEPAASAQDTPPRLPLDPDILTLGFARRFAEYKRTNLLLTDPERLLRLLHRRDRPVQLIIAGKAHPQDALGKSLLREWQDFIARPEVRGRVVFVEDHDLGLAARLAQGVDLWINTPRRPWEACGTSGMKVLVNGGLNLSELDGWWAEAYAPDLGWALGDGEQHTDAAAWDRIEAQALYRLLEEDVVPCFYARDAAGLPQAWLDRVRASMVELTGRFSSNRMLREYAQDYYLPLAKAYRQRDKETAAGLEDWYQHLAANWDRIRFGALEWTTMNDRHTCEIQVYLDGVPPDSVAVQLYAEPRGDGPAALPVLQRGRALAGGGHGHVYHGTVPADRPASDYTPRVVPAHAQALVPLEAHCILWYR